MAKTVNKKLKRPLNDIKSTKGSEMKRLRKYQDRVLGVNEFLMGYSAPAEPLAPPAATLPASRPPAGNFSRLVRIAARFRNQPIVPPPATSSYLKGTAWREFLRVRAGILRFKRKIRTERRRSVFKTNQPAQSPRVSVKAKISRLFKTDAAQRQIWWKVARNKWKLEKLSSAQPQTRLAVLKALKHASTHAPASDRYATALRKTSKRELSYGRRLKTRQLTKLLRVSVPANAELCVRAEQKSESGADRPAGELPLRVKISPARLQAFRGYVPTLLSQMEKNPAFRPTHYALVRSYFKVLEPLSRSAAFGGAVGNQLFRFSRPEGPRLSAQGSSKTGMTPFLNPVVRAYVTLGSRAGFGSLTTFLRGRAFQQLLPTAKTIFTESRVKGRAPVCASSAVSLRAYTGKLWALLVRLRVEKFFFKRLGRRTYVWFYNIWSIFLKKIWPWRKFEQYALWRLTFKNTRFYLKASIARLFVRTMGIMVLVPGSMHCFLHIVALLLKKFRRHWQVLQQVKDYLDMSQHEVFNSCEVHYRMIVCGRFAGQMRAGKKVIEKGRIKLFNFLLPIEFLHVDSCTRWGVFGINMWLQVIPKKITN